MRSLLILLLSLLLMAPAAQAQRGNATSNAPVLPVDPETKQVTYQGVVEVPGATKDQLYERALEWMVKTYGSANDVVQIKDKAQGKLVAKGVTVLTQPSLKTGMALLGVGVLTPGLLLEQIHTIYLKDGRYKYVLTAQALKGPYNKDDTRFPLEANTVPAGFSKKAWEAALAQADAKMKAVVSSLNQALQTKSKDPSDF